MMMMMMMLQGNVGLVQEDELHYRTFLEPGIVHVFSETRK